MSKGQIDGARVSSFVIVCVTWIEKAAIVTVMPCDIKQSEKILGRGSRSASFLLSGGEAPLWLLRLFLFLDSVVLRRYASPSEERQRITHAMAIHGSLSSLRIKI